MRTQLKVSPKSYLYSTIRKYTYEANKAYSLNLDQGAQGKTILIPWKELHCFITSGDEPFPAGLTFSCCVFSP